MGDADVTSRYFPEPVDCPSFVEDTEWYPLPDGEHYFGQLHEQLRLARAGDTVLIAGLEVDPALDLTGRQPGEPGYRGLGELLARLAADGVDVRVLIAGRVLASSIPWAGLGPFRGNAAHAEQLRGLRPDGLNQLLPPPLTGRVLLDFSGAILGSNHQKAVVVHVDGELTSFVAGIDLVENRFDGTPHDRLRIAEDRWGWHDIAVRLRGPGAERVWDIFCERWQETTTLPPEHYLRSPLERRLLNPGEPVPAPGPAPRAQPVTSPGTAVRVLRSRHSRKLDSLLPFRRKHWDVRPHTELHEVFTTVVTALGAAERYIYLEDQYLEEGAGGDEAFELYPYLRAAAQRGVKVILVGSGTRDPEDPGFHPKKINRKLNRDLQEKIVDRLADVHRHNFAVFRVENCTVHAKLILIDDVFANIGSANMFSRSMVGADSELSAAVVTTTSLVRDLRVAVWADHLRTPVTDELRGALEDIDLALGIFRSAWLPARTPTSTWQVPGSPAGFAPFERVLELVGPK